MHIAVIRFDRWRIDDLQRELDSIGCAVALEAHGQGYKDMTPALEAFEALLLNGKLRHGLNPVLTWMSQNAVQTMDAAGGRKLDKAKSTGRIDGIVALVMASGMRPTAKVVGLPAYDERGLFRL